MRIILAFCAFFIVLFIGSGMILIHQNSPEKLLMGKWEEVSWEYEKVNDSENREMSIDEIQKAEICRSMVIHIAEVWEFDEGHHLKLYQNNQLKEDIKWNLKGRGNILEFEHPQKMPEEFQIQELTADSLVIHFNFDLQVRAIVKMIFKRIDAKEYVEKV